MSILGIDPGFKMGWAVMSCDEVTSGQIRFDKIKKQDGHNGARYNAIRQSIAQLRLDAEAAGDSLECICYEKVRRHLGTYAAHVYGAIEAVILMIADDWDVPIRTVEVGTLKKFASGSGAASKAIMLSMARAKWGEHIETDDEADALWIAEWARVNARI